MIDALQSMDDRLLRDIGVYRGEIQNLVAEFDDRELGLKPVGPGNDRSKDAKIVYLQTACIREPARHRRWWRVGSRNHKCPILSMKGIHR